MRVLIAVATAGLLAITATGLAAQSYSRMPDGSFQVAQGGSCQSWFSNCASRCKTRAPTDKSCVSDHCSPKLATCRRTGCWQEGAQYGGAKHCNLSK